MLWGLCIWDFGDITCTKWGRDVSISLGIILVNCTLDPRIEVQDAKSH